MRLANVSICLVFAVFLGGCCPTCKDPSPSENLTTTEQSVDFTALNLKSINLDKAFTGKGVLTKQGKAEFKGIKELPADNPIILISENIDAATAKNLQKNFEILNLKKSVLIYDIKAEKFRPIYPPKPPKEICVRGKCINIEEIHKPEPVLDICLRKPAKNVYFDCILGKKGEFIGKVDLNSSKKPLNPIEILDTNLTYTKKGK